MTRGSLWPVPEDLPATYRVERARGGVLALRSDAAEALAGAGFGPAGGERLSTSDLSGRRPLREIVARGERFVVRHFQHGGLFRWLTGARYADPERPFRELLVSERLTDLGLSTPRVVAARARRALPWGWRLSLVTRRVEDALDLGEALERVRAGELGAAARSALFRAAGELIGRLHAAGFWHADLTPRNLLVQAAALEGAEPEVWIIDLDRCGFREPLDDDARRDNLRRLYRAVCRREERGAGFLARSDYLRFLSAYGRALGRAGWERRADWEAIRAEHESAGLLHRLGWVVEQAFGGGPETRDGRAVVRR